MSSLALLLLVRADTHSFALAGGVVGAFSVAEAVFAPVLGALVDRAGPALVLLPSAAAQAVLLAGLVLVAQSSAPATTLIALAAGSGACMPPVSACVRMLWPRIATDRALRDAAYALDATSQEVVWTAGPLLVGVLAGAFSPQAAVLAAAGISVAGTAWFASSPLARGSARGPLRQPRANPLASVGVRTVLNAGALLGVSFGAVEVGLPALALRDHARGAAGLLLGTWSIGSMAGGLFYGARSWHLGLERRLPILLAANAAVTLPLVLASGIGSALILSLVAGLCGAPVFSCLYSLIGEHAPEGTTAQAFTWSTTALVAGLAAGSAGAGVVVAGAGVAAAFALSGAAAMMAAAVAFFSVGRLAPPVCAPAP
jgi:MFS family permease